MSSDTSIHVRISFLEGLNEEMRRYAAQVTAEQAVPASYLPMMMVSGFVSLSAWTLSWIS